MEIFFEIFHKSEIYFASLENLSDICEICCKSVKSFRNLKKIYELQKIKKIKSGKYIFTQGTLILFILNLLLSKITINLVYLNSHLYNLTFIVK